ncbi:hypothetical protein LBMAG45_05250 [Nitrospirota bacterium]|nr:hypothetical protein LBMAG45_05250 [Nitrospirota bacterium]
MCSDSWPCSPWPVVRPAYHHEMGWKGKRESYWQKGQQDMAALIDRTVKDQA